MAFTYGTLSGVTRYPEVEAQIADMDDSAAIESFIEFISANRFGDGVAITTTIDTAAKYNALIAAWGGYRNIKK